MTEGHHMTKRSRFGKGSYCRMNMVDFQPSRQLYREGQSEAVVGGNSPPVQTAVCSGLGQADSTALNLRPYSDIGNGLRFKITRESPAFRHEECQTAGILTRTGIRSIRNVLRSPASPRQTSASLSPSTLISPCLLARLSSAT